MMAEDLRNLRSTTTKLEKECAEIRGKFDETSVKISESLSKLQLKVEEQVLTFKNYRSFWTQFAPYLYVC